MASMSAATLSAAALSALAAAEALALADALADALVLALADADAEALADAADEEPDEDEQPTHAIDKHAATASTATGLTNFNVPPSFGSCFSESKVDAQSAALETSNPVFVPQRGFSLTSSLDSKR